MKNPRVIIVEDQRALALALAAAVRQLGAPSELAPTAAQARALMESSERFDAMILDIGLPDENGLAFLGSLAPEARPPTIVVTAHGEIQNTIEARKLGVVEFLTKPLDFAEFQESLRRILDAGGSASGKPEDIGDAEDVAFIGAAAAMRPVFRQIAHACASDDPVLVRGETGTGKSHAARLIEKNSGRSGETRTLVAGPATTVEELTQAYDEAGSGVLVMEDVELLPPVVQAELVRRIEAEGEGVPRLVATTGDDLHARVREEAFRSDLFYRLQVLEVRLPPMRDRMDDLPALVSYFLGQLMPGRVVEVSEAAMAQLSAHEWPGNLLELRNTLAYALTVNSGARAIDVPDLPSAIAGGEVEQGAGERWRLIQALDGWLDARLEGGDSVTYRSLSEGLEAELIRRLLKRYDGKLARLAAALGANRTTLRKRLRD